MRRDARSALPFNRPEREDIRFREIDVVNRRRNGNQMKQALPVIMTNPDGEPGLAQRQVLARDVSLLLARESRQHIKVL